MKQFSRFAGIMFTIAALSGAVSVGLAAFADHGLARMVADGERGVRLFKEATAFQMDHALALLFATLMAERATEGGSYKGFRAAAVLFALGAVLFPSALYTSAFGGPVFWAPWGGTAAIAGWITLAVCSLLSLAKRNA